MLWQNGRNGIKRALYGEATISAWRRKSAAKISGKTPRVARSGSERRGEK